MSEYLYDLGGHSFPVTTASAEAQTWFDRGMTWTYGYNHEEAVACFKHAIEADPACAMAHWGVGYAAGPNYNMPWHYLTKKVRQPAASAGRHPTTKNVRHGTAQLAHAALRYSVAKTVGSSSPNA